MSFAINPIRGRHTANDLVRRVVRRAGHGPALRRFIPKLRP